MQRSRRLRRCLTSSHVVRVSDAARRLVPASDQKVKNNTCATSVKLYPALHKKSGQTYSEVTEVDIQCDTQCFCLQPIFQLVYMVFLHHVSYFLMFMDLFFFSNWQNTKSFEPILRSK